MNDSASQTSSSTSNQQEPTNPASPPTAPAAPEPMLDTAVRCIECGYNLIGLPKTGVCPECGTPAENSTRGTMLAYSSLDHIKKLHKGVYLIQAAVVASIMVTIATLLLTVLAGLAAMSAVAVEIIVQIVGIVIGVVSLYGWWIFSEADPDYTGKDVGDNARRFVRAAVIARVVMWVVVLPFSFMAFSSATSSSTSASASFDLVQIGAGLLNGAATLFWFISSMLYIKWLGARLPSHRIVKRAKLLVWLGPVLSTVGIVLLGLGPLIALVLYWRLLDWVRKEFKRIEAEKGRHLAVV